MLRVQAISAGQDVAAVMTNKGITLAPKAGTPLKILFDYSTKGSQVITSTDPNTNCDVYDIVKGITNGNLNGETAHDVSQKEIEEVLYRNTSNAIAFARNVVNPAIKAIHETVATAANEVSNISRLGILPFYYDELFDLPVWSAMIAKHDEIPVSSVRVDVTAFPLGLDPAWLLETIKTGSTKIDERIQAIISTQADDYLNSIYAALFANDNDANARLSLLSRTGGGEFTFASNRLNVPHCAVAYLLAKGMFDNPPEGVKLSKADYELQVSSVLAQAGRRLCRAIETRKEDLRTKFLVISMPQPGWNYNGQNIVVNGDVYDKFLADGGTPEILIGNVQIAGDSFLPGIVARAEEALRAYRKHEAEIVEQHDASFVSRVKSALYNAVLELVRNTPDDELSRSRADCVSELREHTKFIGRAELNNLWVLIRRLVCHVLYPHSDALKILSLFDDIAARQPNDSVELVEYHVMLSYLVEYLSECLVVQEIK